MSTSFKPTFGVEFEFVVRFDADKYERDMSAPDIAVYFSHTYSYDLKLNIIIRIHMIRALRKFGFEVHEFQGLSKPSKGYDKWGVVSDGSIYPSPEGIDPEFSEWSFTGIEVRSPVLLLGSAAFREIEEILRVIHTQFNVFVNTSCGLHIHVGDRGNGFPVATVKNLCLLVTGFERQFNSLHPLHRIDNLYSKPPSRAVPPASLVDKLHAIDALETIPEIVHHFNTFEDIIDSAMAYNFMNLQYTEKHTIEFRQHAGTLDPTAVIKWIELITGLVSLCHETPYPAFEDLLQNHINDPNFSIVDLLHALNLHVVADYYQRRGLFTHRPQEWDWVDSPLAQGRVIEEEEEEGFEGFDSDEVMITPPSSSPHPPPPS